MHQSQLTNSTSVSTTRATSSTFSRGGSYGGEFSRRAWGLLAMVMIAAIMMTGCVAQEHADDLQTLNRKLREQIVELEARLEEAQARVTALQEMQNAGSADLMAKLNAALADRDRLKNALSDAEDQLRRAAQAGPMLPAPLDNALADLAASNPALMTYDPARGAVVFTSDLTFALGSTQVSAQAQSSLTKLAGILRSSIAAGYEAQIVGHTDNVPINKPATRAAHPTNWHLSVHRAISVKDVLQKAGVAPTQMMVAGYGQFHPVAANPTKGGNQANRRVEIFLVPSTATAVSQDVEPEPIADMEPTVTAPADPAPVTTESTAPETYK